MKGKKMLYIKKITSRLKIYFNVRYQMQRKLKGKLVRGFITKINIARKPKSKELLSYNSEVAELQSLGLLKFNKFLAKNEIDNLFERVSKLDMVDRFRPHLGKFSVNNAPDETHVADCLVTNWLEFPELVRVANDPKILSIVEQYLGCKPTISNLQLWWSFPGHQVAEEAENFHRDVDDWKFLKLFLYITDVDESSGPHVYVTKSIQSHRWLPIKRYSDERIVELFGSEDINILTGNAGDAFLEDTFGFHKGLVAKSKKRLLFQVQYSINDIAINKYAPVPFEISDMNIDRYINRLYFS